MEKYYVAPSLAGNWHYDQLRGEDDGDFVEDTWSYAAGLAVGLLVGALGMYLYKK